MADVRRAIEFIIGQQEPYPAFVLNRRWDVLVASRGAARLATFLCGGSRHSNMLLQFFDPEDLRAAVVNWEEVAGDLMRHLHDEVTAASEDSTIHGLLEQVLRYPGVPSHWRTRELGEEPPPILTVVFRKGGQTLRFFSTITTFGTPRARAGRNSGAGMTSH